MSKQSFNVRRRHVVCGPSGIEGTMPSLTAFGRSRKAEIGNVVLPVEQESGASQRHGRAGHMTGRIHQESSAGHPIVWSIEASAGREFVVCPRLSFQVQNCISIKVESVSACSAVESSAFSIKVAGTWQGSPGSSERTQRVTVILVKTAAVDRDAASHAVTSADASNASAEAWSVQALEGPLNLKRCSQENWLAVTTDGGPLTSLLPHGILGSNIILQRPRERVYVLRSPEEQLSRLLVDLSKECGEPLLAAPAAHGAVALMGYKNLVPSAVLSHIEQRFSVVFSQSETIPVTQATEAILRRIIAFGAKHALCQQSWQTVEFPYRLFQSDALSRDVLQRPSLRVPCVDIACEKAHASPTKVVAELCLTTAVRLIQPLAPFLMRAAKCPELPELAGRFRLDGSKAVLRPPTHVLPRLTAAEITHIWSDGFLPTGQLPVELQTREAFVEYWRMIHGWRLSVSDLSSFARVEFAGQKANPGLVLTYPVSCLWRTPWTEQPALSRQHGHAILKQVFEGLEQQISFASQLSSAENVDPLTLHVLLPKDSLKVLRPSKIVEPDSTQKSQADEVPEKSRKRRLLLPLVQSVATPNPASISRQKQRRLNS